MEKFKIYFECGNRKAKYKEYQEAILDYSKALAIISQMLIDSNKNNLFSLSDDQYRLFECQNEEMNIYYPKNKYRNISKIIKAIFLKRGDAQFNIKEYDEAISDYTAAIKIDPEYCDAFLKRGDVKNILKDYDGAIADYNSAILINPKFTDAINKRGEVKFSLKDYQGAIIDYTFAIAINPQDPILYINRGKTYLYLEQYNESITEFDKAIRIKLDFAEAYFYRGEALRLQGYYKKAIADFSLAIEINPQYTDALFSRAIAKSKSNTYGAKNDYFLYIKIKPQNSTAYINLGVIESKLKNYNEALKHYDTAIKIKSGNLDVAYFYRANTKIKLLDFEGALSDYNNSIKCNTNYALSYFKRGNVKIILKDYKGAIDDYCNAIEIKPEFKKAIVARDKLVNSRQIIENLISALNKMGAKLYHACQYIDFLTFLELDGIISRHNINNCLVRDNGKLDNLIESTLGRPSFGTLCTTPYHPSHPMYSHNNQIHMELSDKGHPFAFSSEDSKFSNVPNPCGPILLVLNPEILRYASDVSILLSMGKNTSTYTKKISTYSEMDRIFKNIITNSNIEEKTLEIKNSDEIKKEFNLDNNYTYYPELCITVPNEILDFQSNTHQIIVDPYHVNNIQLLEMVKEKVNSNNILKSREYIYKIIKREYISQKRVDDLNKIVPSLVNNEIEWESPQGQQFDKSPFLMEWYEKIINDSFFNYKLFEQFLKCLEIGTISELVNKRINIKDLDDNYDFESCFAEWTHGYADNGSDYDEFGGEYGFDDETINDVFEGNPDNYWNVD